MNIDFSQIIFRIKLLSFSLSLVFGGLAVYYIIEFRKLVSLKVQKMKSEITAVDVPLGGVGQSKWDEILSHMESSKEADWKLAIIEADKLVDNLLQSMGYPGDTMGDRLTNMQDGRIRNLEGIWEAHKIRNKLVHDLNYFLRYAEAKRAIQIYREVLKEFNAV